MSSTQATALADNPEIELNIDANMLYDRKKICKL